MQCCVNKVMNFQVPQNAGKLLSSCTIGGFSRRRQLQEVSYLVILCLVKFLFILFSLNFGFWCLPVECEQEITVQRAVKLSPGCCVLKMIVCDSLRLLCYVRIKESCQNEKKTDRDFDCSNPLSWPSTKMFLRLRPSVHRKSSVFWDISLYSLVKCNEYFLLDAWILLVSLVIYASTLKMEPLCFSDTSVDLHLTLSRVRGSVTNNNGFWIGLLDLLPLLYNYN
jgi:hypothetical protein